MNNAPQPSKHQGLICNCDDCKASKGGIPDVFKGSKPVKQDELLKFVTDPKTLAKAVEGSMEKRMKAYYQNGEEVPIIDDSIDVSIGRPQSSKLDDLMHKYAQAVTDMKTDKQYTDCTAQAKADFLALVEEVIGSDEDYHAYKTEDEKINGVVRNHLRAEQRLRKDNL